MDSLDGVFEGLAVPFNNIAEGINTIFELFDPQNEENLFMILFVPDAEFIENQFLLIRAAFELKIPLFNDLITMYNMYQFQLISGTIVEPPVFSITLPGKWGNGATVPIIDFNFFVEYRTLIINIIRAISWFFFLKRLLKKMPDLVY